MNFRDPNYPNPRLRYLRADFLPRLVFLGAMQFIGIARAADAPAVIEVEGQPLAANVIVVFGAGHPNISSGFRVKSGNTCRMFTSGEWRTRSGASTLR